MTPTARFVGTLLLLASIVVLGPAATALAQGIDTEPNNTCQTAQNFGAVTLPFTATGTLGSPNVDFFRITATPGSVLLMDLEGAPTGQGTLEDPFLGLFDSACSLLKTADDFGGTLNSRTGIVVPQDGVVIVAATACCTSTFEGSGSADGSYRLTVATGGVIRGTTADSLGHALPLQVMAFTPGGVLSGAAFSDCCENDQASYELFVAAGVHRVVVQSNQTRVWHQGRPTFLQADGITVGAGQQIAGIDFTVPRNARIVPALNQSAFTTGQTLLLDLLVQNPSPTAVSVRIVASALVPGEPGIDRTSFCCFEDVLVLFEQAGVQLAAQTDATLPGAVSYVFNGTEPPGDYTICVGVQQGRSSAQQCEFFSFAP
jgi:hypothetical protein